MPIYARNLDLYQGYNFKKDKQLPVGFITSMTVGGTALSANQTCKDPTAPTTDLTAVAVLNMVEWGTGVTDAISFSGQIEASNKQSIDTLVISSLTSVEVVFQFKIYDYDPVAKAYFLCFQCSDTDMNGLIEKNGEELNIHVAPDPTPLDGIASPVTYSFSIGIKPQPSAQTLTIATASTKNVVKSWGLTVS